MSAVRTTFIFMRVLVVSYPEKGYKLIATAITLKDSWALAVSQCVIFMPVLHFDSMKFNNVKFTIPELVVIYLH